MKRLVILISGRGSNMRAIVEACSEKKINGEVVAVISNTPDAAGLEFAKTANIPTVVVNSKDINDRAAFDQHLKSTIDAFEPDWIVLAGFMRILGADFVNAYVGQIVNIHPSLLPKHPGLNTHARALAAGDKVHGATVHFVTPELDAGPVIAQTEVAVLQNDTENSLADKVLRTEHSLYVNALQLCVTGDVRYINGECYRVNDKNLTDNK